MEDSRLKISDIYSSALDSSLIPTTQKVFWRSSQRDTDDIDLDELKKLPGSDDEEELLLKKDPSLSQIPSSYHTPRTNPPKVDSLNKKSSYQKLRGDQIGMAPLSKTEQRMLK